MAGISSKAVLKALTPFKGNGGCDFEDEGSLDYYNTFYRKYDAQIGRFTGIDIKAESFAGLSPFQFGNNNPAMFNDPMGDKFVNIKPADPMANTFAWALSYRSSLVDENPSMKIQSMWDNIMAGTGGGAAAKAAYEGKGSSGTSANANGVSWGIASSSLGTNFSGGAAQLVFAALFGSHADADECNIDISFNSDFNAIGGTTSFSSANNSDPSLSVTAHNFADGTTGLLVYMNYTDFTGKYTNMNFIQTVEATENGKKENIIYDKAVKNKQTRTNFYYAEDDETNNPKERISGHTITINGITSVNFFDNPAEERFNGTTYNDLDWNAQLSLVGMENGTYQIIYTVSYGYGLLNNHFGYGTSTGSQPYILNTTPSDFLINGLP